ncbi:unnamed protein product [Ranitomeya imitator]|uniref:Uncharacterized protein n=1 Tax=Ranitomeya imitator TaxID=111125 RepID=A0ABN9M0S6_9NEOB|nr:unnamed protein product [Ranitomeya imitator]
MEFRLPSEKIDGLIELIDGCLSVGKVSLTRMQSLLGSLNFACRVILMGRIFSCRLALATQVVKQLHHRIRITSQLRGDLMDRNNPYDWWPEAFYRDSSMTQPPQVAIVPPGYRSGSWTCWFQRPLRRPTMRGKWPEHWFTTSWTKNLTLLELFPIALAMENWGEFLGNKRIRLQLRNTSAVHAINYLSSSSALVIKLIRVIVLKSLSLNLWFRARTAPESTNNMFDAVHWCELQGQLGLQFLEHLEGLGCPPSMWNVLEN